MGGSIWHADCMAVLPTLPDASIDAIVTDPPYELGFMGKRWDGTGIAYDVGLWRECLRVLKPGGHLAAFGGTRTYHRMACAIEDAGFDIRDSLQWLYGSGFPKSLDVGKAIDKVAGAEREVIGHKRNGATALNSGSRVEHGYRPTYYDASVADITAPATDAARQWQGFGTALKPAWEPIVLARRPLNGTVAACVLAHGTGALNIDATRVTADWTTDPNRRGWQGGNSQSVGVTGNFGNTGERVAQPHAQGRWPANVILSHGESCGDGGPCQPGCVVTELDAQTADLKGGVTVRRNLRGQEQNANGIYGSRSRDASEDVAYGDSGGASRFFPVFRYQAKAPTSERPKVDGIAHPTVKPLSLMKWLVRLICPPGGIVLDPFAGSGTTLQAARDEGFSAIGIERERDYYRLAFVRLGLPDPGLADAVAS